MIFGYDETHAMALALRALPDLAPRPARAAAYLAAGIDPGDIARLDRYALAAESERRRLFPKTFFETPPAAEPADTGAMTS